MPKARWALGLMLFAALAGGCSRKPAAIEVSPRPVRIFGLQRSQRLTGRLVDKKGRPVQSGSLKWSSSKNDVVTVDSVGQAPIQERGPFASSRRASRPCRPTCPSRSWT